MSFPTSYTRRDREVILDVLIRLYTARLPITKPRDEDADDELLLRSLQDAIETAVPILGLERPSEPTTPRTQH
jgi:hypothetical protein